LSKLESGRRTAQRTARSDCTWIPVRSVGCGIQKSSGLGRLAGNSPHGLAEEGCVGRGTLRRGKDSSIGHKARTAQVTHRRTSSELAHGAETSGTSIGMKCLGGEGGGRKSESDASLASSANVWNHTHQGTDSACRGCRKGTRECQSLLVRASSSRPEPPAPPLPPNRR
jgi:hypothetical protein